MKVKSIADITFQLDLSKPIYEQLILQIEQAVVRGEVERGKKLPSVRQMAKILKINPSTVMRAYRVLEQKGLCEFRSGQGTFITSSASDVAQFREQLVKRTIEDFVAEMRALGLNRNRVQKLLEEAEW